MKKLSLQWRLTLMTATLVTAVCLLLNLFISKSAVMRINEIENYMIQVAPNGQEAFTLDISSLYPSLEAQIQQTTDDFRLHSVLITLVVILLSSAFTYFLAGRALAPLRKFSAHMEKVQAQNLSEPLTLPRAEDEIAQLSRAFNRMLARLEHSFSVQHQFSANAAHELRTPLAVMQTRLDILKKKGDASSEEYKETIQMISEQTERLSHLVEILLELTELDTVKQCDQISLAALIEEVICDLTQIAEEKQITLIQEPGEAELTASELLLYRAIYNLVENAIKYNHPKGSVTVSVDTKPGWAFVHVTDTGIGIDTENWERIFEPFVRVDKSRSRAMGGTGLGLALVRDIAKQHGGNVQIIKSSPQGTEILLELPVSTQTGS